MKTWTKWIFNRLIKVTWDKEKYWLRDNKNHKNVFFFALSTVIEKDAMITRFVFWRFMIESAKFI